MNSVKVDDIVGILTVVGIYSKRTNDGKQNKKICICQCQCGSPPKHIYLGNLQQKQVVSCGCVKRKKASIRLKQIATKHNLRDHPIYNTWNGMVQRCNNPKSHGYDDYGGRGINVCLYWLNVENFIEWSYRNEWNPGLSIDRINVNAGYCPENCRWVNHIEQANNRRDNYWITAFGETKTVSMWCRDNRCKVSKSVLSYRIKNNWNAEKAIITQTKYKGKINGSSIQSI